MMNLVKYCSMTLAFFLELAMLAAFGWWGFQQGNNSLAKYAVAASLVLLASVLWGIFAAPKSKRRLTFIPRLAFQLCMFLTAAFLLHKTGQQSLAIGLAALAVVNTGVAYVFKF